MKLKTALENKQINVKISVIKCIDTSMFREEFELLDALQTRLALYPLTAPLLGNNHSNFRGRGCPVGTLHIHNEVKLHKILSFCPFHMFVILIEKSFGVDFRA